MTFTFKARIYKTGINWAVDVPEKVSSRLIPERGYIRVKGRINAFEFKTTLVPVKEAPYRLFVNGLMMKGAETAVGKIARFELEQNSTKLVEEYPMLPALKKALEAHQLLAAFQALRPSRIKDVLKYLHYLKTQETRQKNIDKVIWQLQNKNQTVRIP